MKKQNKFALLLLLGCCFALSACAKQQEVPAQSAAQPTTIIQEQSQLGGQVAVTVAAERYRTSFFSSNRLAMVTKAGADNDSVYFWGIQDQRQDETQTEWVISFGTDGSTSEQQVNVPPGSYITAQYVLDRQLYYIERADYEEGTTSWFLHTPQGTVQLDWATQTNDLRELTIVDERAYIANGAELYTCSLPDGAVLCTAVADASIKNIFHTKDGRTVVYCYGSDNLFQLENDGQTLRKLGKLPLLFQGRSLVSGDNTAYDCLVIGESALFGWNFGAQETTQLLSFDTYGLSAYNISALICTPGGSFLGATWRSGDMTDRLFRIDPTDETQLDVSEKMLRVGGVSRPLVISAAIADFKALYPEYVVEYVDYQELYGEKAEQQLQIDLVQGNAPDLLFVNGLPVEAYGKKGLLEDLYTWIDADKTINREQFTQNLLAVMESTDDSLYQLPISYTIATTIGSKTLAGSREKWTFAAINEELEQNDTLQAVFYALTQENLVGELPCYMTHMLVDYKNARSMCTSDETLAFLTFLQQIKPHEQLQYQAINQIEALQNGEVLFVQTMLSEADAFAQTEEEFGTELVYPDYPGADGGCFYLNLPMAIPTTAKEKQGAWELMKMLFSSSFYATRGGWIPLQSGFETAMQDALAQGVPEQSVQKLTQLQALVHTLFYYDASLCNILSEETSYLFAGVRTAEQTAEHIDQRVQLYLDEQYG